MKYLVTVIIAFFIFGCSQKKVERESFSSEALSGQVVDLNGNKITFAEILDKNKGNLTVIEVWASWCSDCVKAIPLIKELQADDPEVKYVFLSMDKNSEAWKKGIKQHNIQGAHYWAEEGMKGAFAKSLDVNWIPRYIIVDRDGKIALYNAIETDFDKIKETLKNIK